ncbi:MAG TPA: RIP metalloprotease RseP [Bacteroidia bacterium]|nr:RIP metalloprotease RseP [Bacteroidia bacterium]HNT80317.1 RIP metalloprotease RseP [Bacteroidia bacterium]
MNGLIMAGQLILGLGILVFIHELGHFLAARAFGIRVEKFYLFFDAWGVKLFNLKKGETEYGVGWLPLGGYVKISGMIDESMDAEQMKSEPQPWEFRSKPAWQRLIVMIAGVVMNVILGIAIYTGNLLYFKKEYLPNAEVSKGIYSYALGQELGLQNGDKIVAIDGKSFERFEELYSTRILFGATLTVDRAGETKYIEVPENFYRKVGASGRWNFIGTGTLQHTIMSVSENDNAAKAGLKEGDQIVAVNGASVQFNDGLREILSTKKGGSVQVQVLRSNQTMDYTVDVSENGTIGIGYQTTSLVDSAYTLQPYTFASALSFGTSDAFEALISNIKGLKQIFAGKEKVSDSVQGPIGIATIYGATFDWARFWAITGLLSMVLALMNILPIPALDGGHVLFLLIEVVTRRKFSDKFMERTQVVGMVILLTLMVFVLGNDIWKHILN